MRDKAPTLAFATAACLVATLAAAQRPTSMPRAPLPPGVRAAPVLRPGATRAAMESAAAQEARVVARRQVDSALGTTTATTNIRVVRASGQSTLPVNQATIALKPGEWVMHKTADSAVLRPEASRSPAGEPTGPSSTKLSAVLPIDCLTVDSSGAILVVVPKVIVQSGGLMFDAGAHSYRGVVYVGVEKKNQLAAGRTPLARPLRMLLTLSGPGEVTPANLATAHTGFEYTPIQLSARTKSSISLLVRTAGNDTGIVVPLQTFQDTLSLTVSPREIEGLGLETTELSVSLPTATPAGDTVMVHFDSPTLQIEPSTIKAVVNGANVLRVRSGKPGEHTITASAAGFAPSSQSVRFVWPISFATATIVGILLGGWAREADGKRRLTARSVLSRAPFGIAAAIVAALGIDQFGLALAGRPLSWVAIMLTATLGAWVGRTMLDKLTGQKPPAGRTRLAGQNG